MAMLLHNYAGMCLVTKLTGVDHHYEDVVNVCGLTLQLIYIYMFSTGGPMKGGCAFVVYFI